MTKQEQDLENTLKTKKQCLEEALNTLTNNCETEGDRCIEKLVKLVKTTIDTADIILIKQESDKIDVGSIETVQSEAKELLSNQKK